MPELTERDRAETRLSRSPKPSLRQNPTQKLRMKQLRFTIERKQLPVQQDYPVYFEGLRGDDYSWVFNTEDTSFT